MLKFIRNFFNDGYKKVGLLAPGLSISYTLLKAFEVDLKGLKELSYAWALLPLLVWVLMAYISRFRSYNELEIKCAEKKRTDEQVRTLKNFYTQLTEFRLETDDVDDLGRRFNLFIGNIETWLSNNLGTAVAARFSNIKSYQGEFASSKNRKHDDIKHCLMGHLETLEIIIEDDKWDD